MTSSEPKVAVRLLIYSGKPDPEWSLNEGETDQLRDRAKKTLGVEAVESMPRRDLGYGGFQLETQGEIPGIPERFTTFQGIVAETSGQEVSYWKDLGEVEQWLLVQARHRGFGDLLDVSGAST